MDAREGTENLAALRAAVFLLLRKNHRGAIMPRGATDRGGDAPPPDGFLAIAPEPFAIES